MSKFQKFDNIFNCPRCNKTLWQYQITKDGKKLCPDCYQEYLKEENERTSKKQDYIEKKTKEVIDRGLTDLIFNFFEKKYSANPTEEELKKLWKLLKIKYETDIEYDSFFEIINGIYKNNKEKRELESFEQDLMRRSQPDEKGSYYCAVCKAQIDKQTYEFSYKNFNKGLCSNHQGTQQQRDLYFALKKRGIPCEFEAYDGYKNIDIAIHDIKLYIEIGETLDLSDYNKFLDDLRKDRFTSQGGYQTRRVNNEIIDGHLDELSETIKEIYLKSKIF